METTQELHNNFIREDIMNYESVNNSDIQKAVAKGKILVLLTNSSFDPSRFAEFTDWDKVTYMTKEPLEMKFTKNTILLFSVYAPVLSVCIHVQLCYYHDRRYGCPMGWIGDIADSYPLIKITKPWQVTGYKPPARRGAIELSRLYPKNEHIVRFCPHNRGLITSICIFYVNEDERLPIYFDPSESHCEYKEFIRHVFECYASNSTYIRKYHVIAAGILKDVGMVGEFHFTSEEPNLFTKPCSNHNARDVENGPPLIMKLNKKLNTTPSGDILSGKQEFKRGRKVYSNVKRVVNHSDITGKDAPR